MIFNNIQGTRILAVGCGKPSMINHAGRIWSSGHINIDGEVTEIFFDSERGEYAYFCLCGMWYKMRMQSTYTEDLNGAMYSIDPNDEPEYKVFRK